MADQEAAPICPPGCAPGANPTAASASAPPSSAGGRGAGLTVGSAVQDAAPARTRDQLRGAASVQEAGRRTGRGSPQGERALTREVSSQDVSGASLLCPRNNPQRVTERPAPP